MEALEQKFVENIARSKGITVAKATEMVDLCVKMTSAQLGLEYSVVYASIHSEGYMKECLVGKCSDLDLKQCAESCKCVVFEGACVPRRFEEADKMNQNPDKYVEKMPTDALANVVKLASYLYYNYDGGGLTDNTFDALQYHLQRRLKQRGRVYEKIGAPPVEKIRTQLPYPMASLDKVKPGSRELLDFVVRAPELVWSHKLDGVSGLVVYVGGKPDKLYTRGDGTVGGDVTYLTEFIKLPTIKVADSKNIVVRGEFILSKQKWQDKYSTPADGIGYSNPRSFVSGKINAGHISQGLQDIDFVAYEIVDTGSGKGKVPEPFKALKLLDALGFNVVPHGTLKEPTIFEIMSLYKDQRATSPYMIDGLVLSLNLTRDVVSKLANPKHSVAFKMKLEEQIRKSKVLDIDWNISRYGRLVPVVNFESVYIDGVRMHRASAFNAAHVRDWSLGKGSIIKVFRSGDVIPTILDVEVNEAIEPIFPPLGLKWHWQDKDIYLDDIEGNRTVQIKRLEHFFVTIGVPRLREKTLEKLYDNGFKTIKSLTSAKPADFIKVKGIGKKTSESHYKNIHDTMRKTRIDRFIPASSTLMIGIGRKLVKQLMRYHPTILEDSEETITKVLKAKKIPGFGPKRIENVAQSIPKFRAFLFGLNKNDIKYAIKTDEERRETIKEKGYNAKIRGKSFVLTGFFGKVDYELEDYIYDNFGNFSSTVTEGTAAVISGNLLDVTSKVMTAQTLKVPVLSIEEFVRKFDVPYSKFVKEGEGEADVEIQLEVDEE